MPRITLPGTLEVSMPRLGTIRATSCVTNALSTCTRGETVPEFVQIQSQYNLNFAGPPQRGNPTVSCQPDPAQKAKPHRDLTLLTPARQSFFGGSWNLFKQLSLTHEPC